MLLASTSQTNIVRVLLRLARFVCRGGYRCEAGTSGRRPVNGDIQVESTIREVL